MWFTLLSNLRWIERNSIKQKKWFFETNFKKFDKALTRLIKERQIKKTIIKTKGQNYRSI